jgi:hypothetical protein
LKKVRGIRTHAAVHQTIVQIIKTMETDEAMKFVYSHEQVKSRRLASGETVALCQNLAGLQLSPLIFAEALICAAGFPASPTPPVIEMGEDQLHIHLEKITSNLLLPFTNETVPGQSSKRPLPVSGTTGCSHVLSADNALVEVGVEVCHRRACC